jgi:hypothetical protein
MDVVCVNESTTKSVKLKSEGVDEVKNEVVEVFFSKLSAIA